MGEIGYLRGSALGKEISDQKKIFLYIKLQYGFCTYRMFIQSQKKLYQLREIWQKNARKKDDDKYFFIQTIKAVFFFLIISTRCVNR